jgi:hypothetical protein
MSEEITIDKVKSIALELCPFPVSEVSFAGSGSNSRIFKIKTSEQDYALKFFRKNPNDVNNRLAAELAASQFFKKFNIPNTSELIQYSDIYNCALFNWIEGTKIEQITRSEIDGALSFIRKIFQVKHGPEVNSFPFGIEACVSGIEVVNQIKKRLINLERSASLHNELSTLLTNKFKPLLNEITITANETYVLSNHNFNDQIKDELLILSPVDFGFHNAILKNKQLIFFDFEYFGWDDPTHLIADTVLHPGMIISNEDKKYFMEVSLELLRKRDPFIENRYAALIPLYALRWACIILNPFLDTYQVIGGNIKSTEDLANLRKKQFIKAEVYLQKATDLLAELQLMNSKMKKK